MFHSPAFFALLAALIMPVISLPEPAPQKTTGPKIVNGHCVEQHSNYKVLTQKAILAKPRLVSGSTCTAGPDGCTISEGKTFSVSITVTVGGNLGLNFGEIATAGIDSSVSIGTTKSTAITTSVNCPPGCDCGLQAVAHMYHITGIHNVVSVNPAYTRGPRCDGEQNVAYPFDATVPITVPGAAPNAGARVDFSACRVGGTFCGPYKKPLIPLCPGT